MLGINSLNSAEKVIQTSQPRISQKLDATIAHPRQKTEDIELRSRETTILTKENSPDKTKGAASNDRKSVEDLKTEHENKKEALDKLSIFGKIKLVGKKLPFFENNDGKSVEDLKTEYENKKEALDKSTIFEKIKLGWKELPVFEKIAAVFLMVASAALAIAGFEPLAGILATVTIVYIAKDVQRKYDKAKPKIEAEYLGNLNGSLKASSENLKANLKKAEEENKELKNNLDSLSKDLDKIRNQATEAKENIGKLKYDLKIQQEQYENIKTDLIDNILTAYESISKAQQNPISKLKSTNENFEQISTSNNEISSKVKEIQSISNNITSEINSFYSKIIKSNDNNQGINKELLSKKLQELSSKELLTIINDSNKLLDNILQENREINDLSLKIQAECTNITKNLDNAKEVVSGIITSVEESQKKYEEALIDTARNIILNLSKIGNHESSNEQGKECQLNGLEELKVRAHFELKNQNNTYDKTFFERIAKLKKEKDIKDLVISSKNAIDVIKSFKVMVMYKNGLNPQHKILRNIEDFIDGFSKNGNYLEELKEIKDGCKKNIQNISKSVEESMEIAKNITSVSNEINGVAKNIKNLSIGDNNSISNSKIVAGIGIAAGAIAASIFGAPLVAVGGLAVGAYALIDKITSDK